MKKNEEAPKGKTIGRANARELTPEEVTLVSGGLLATTSCCAGTCCGGCPDDCGGVD